jgi:Mrp family chromosome partitioning ATPase
MATEQCSAQTTPDRSEKQKAEQLLRERMEAIGHKLLVLSGKGGVGKSTVAVNLAVSLARAGKRVGLLDVDVHGPSVPKLMGLEEQQVFGADQMLKPACSADGVKVMSIGFLLPTQDDAVVWRGPRKYGLIRQFLSGVDWGALDFLVIDAPPGTGDEPMAVAELARPRASALLVTTPQDVAVSDVRRSVTFCRDVHLPVIGVVENMSGLVCPGCGRRIDLFKTGGGERLARAMHVPFLGSVPIDPEVVTRGDEGRPIAGSDSHGATAEAFSDLAECVLNAGLVSGSASRRAGGADRATA